MRALRILEKSAESIRARVQVEVAGALGREPSPADLVRAAAIAHAALDEEGRRALGRSLGPAPACSAGCSYCCHVHVDASAPEILAVAAHLQRTLTGEAMAALEERLARQASITSRLTHQERWDAKIPCALLGEGGRCSIYEARPLQCRSFHSLSADRCRAAFEGRSDEEARHVGPVARANAAVLDGYDLALASAGLSAEVQWLETGLLAALGGPPAAVVME